MKGKIPNNFIKELISATDIVEVVSRFVKLKKMGKNFMACCPFHHEKTPSFSVSAHKQLYYCFGCHAAGDVISFLSTHEHLSFVEAVEELASLKGMTVPFEQVQTDQESADISLIYEALQDASRLFRWNLKHDVNHSEAIEYIKKRGLTKTTVNEYQIGFAPNSWCSLFDTLQAKYSKEVLVQAGLIGQNDHGRVYDRFRHRLIFPIYNRRGQVIGFGGRCLTEDKTQPKYLNSPETPVFHKSEELYGLYELKRRQKPQEIMVVEGYMDVTVLAAYGYPFAVATLGTALSTTHAKILFRETNQIILCFDGDQAGQNAAIRAFQIVVPMLNASCQAKFLILPKGEDPDSYIKKIGREAFLEATKNALGAAEFLLAHLQENKNSDSADELAQLFERAKTILEEIPESTYTLSIITHLAEALKVSSIQLQQILRSGKNVNKTTSIAQKWHLNPAKLSLTEKALAYALNAPKAIAKILNQKSTINFQCFTEQDFILLDALVIIRQNGPLSSALLLQMLSEKHSQFRSYFHQLVQVPAELDDSLIADEFIAILDRIIAQENNNELEQLIQKSKSAILTDAEKQRLQNILHHTVKKNK